MLFSCAVGLMMHVAFYGLLTCVLTSAHSTTHHSHGS